MSNLKGTKEFCPHCKADLTGNPIPLEQQHHYGGATHFKRKIGISCLEGDRVVKWQCPDCKGQWERK